MNLSIIKYNLKKSLFYRLFLTVKSSTIRGSFKKSYPNKPSVRRKAIVSWLLYGVNVRDFNRYHLDQSPLNECRKYVSYSECEILYHKVNPTIIHRLLSDKFLSYQRLRDFYKRDMLNIDVAAEGIEVIKEKVQGFMQQGNTKFVFKPNNSNRGKGIGVYDDVDEFCNMLKINSIMRGGVIESLIVQHKDLAEFNHSSVNTMRINTVNYGGGNVEVVWPCLRMGRQGSFVDNAGAGGVFAAVDSETGLVLGAADEKQHTYTEHPDSHKQLIGYVIPQWQEACELACQAAQRLPEAGFIGWDLALTDKGWVVVEGNHGPLIIWQIASGIGIRDKFNEIENKLVYKK